MDLLRALMAMFKTLVDWQTEVLLADARSAVMVIIVMDLLVFHLLVMAGISRRPGKLEGLIVVGVALVIAYVASDAYIASIR